MSIFSTLKDWLKAAAAPAADPRVTYADPFQKRHELLHQVRRAKARLLASRLELQSKLEEARKRQDELYEAGGEDIFVQQLAATVNQELRAIEGEVRALAEEAAELEAAEQRLMVQEQAFQAREQALSARYNAAEARVRIEEELRGVSNELANLGLAVEKAEQRFEEAEARVSAIDHVAGMGETVQGRPGEAPIAHLLASKYAAEARTENAEPLKRLLSAGFKTLLDLEYEFRQLQALLNRRRATDPLSFGHIARLFEQIYDEGLSVLSDALSLLQAISSPGRERLEQRLEALEQEIASLSVLTTEEARATLGLREEGRKSTRDLISMVRRQQLRAEELLHQGDQCVATLNRTRMELAELKASGAGVTLDSVTQSLSHAIEEAKSVQEEMKLFQS